MIIREELIKEHSKTQCERIVQWIGDSQKRFDELFNIFLNDENRIVQRAAWPMSYCVIVHPELIYKNFSRLVSNLEKPGIHGAVKRNTMRLLQEVDIPRALHGKVMTTCFDYIASPTELVAVKAFALKVLHNLSDIYPEIRPEIRLLIEDRWDHETAAFKNRAKKILQSFQ